jgi:predicted nucleic acid-binding protein
MRAIVDTGPLVAFLNRAEQHHSWARERIEQLEPPFLICEPVLTEALYLFAGYSAARDALFELLQGGVLSLSFHLEEHVSEVRSLLRKYRDRPMSLADACIVRMAEIHKQHAVLTLDSDFTVYRMLGRVPLRLIYPMAA